MMMSTLLLVHAGGTGRGHVCALGLRLSQGGLGKSWIQNRTWRAAHMHTTLTNTLILIVKCIVHTQCGGPDNGTMWQAYSLMRDGLNATGRSIYFSITEQFGRCTARPDGRPGCATGTPGENDGPVPTWNPTEEDGHVPLVGAVPHISMQCFHGAFTPLPWRRQGLHPADLANSWLVEYCNNGPRFGSTLASGGSLLSQLDSQADWTLPELASPGGFNDSE